MSVPDGSTPGTNTFGADVPEMEGSAKQTNYLAAKVSTELLPPVLRGVEQMVQANGGLPSFRVAVAQFFSVAVRAAVDQLAGDFTSQATSTQKAAATFQLSADKMRAEAARITDGLSPTSGSGVA